MKNLWTITTGLMIATLAVTVSAQTDDTFAHRFALDLNGQAAYYTVTLPPSVYTASQTSDLGDLRVLNNAGEPVPYSFDAPAPAKPALAQQTVPWFALPDTNDDSQDAPLGVTIAADGSLYATSTASSRAGSHHGDIVDVGLTGNDASEHIVALLVHVRRDGYQGRVDVEQSDDLRDWQSLAQAQIIRVRSGSNTLVQERIELDGLNSRYLRLHWLDDAPDIASIQIEKQGEANQSADASTPLQWRQAVHVTQGKTPGVYLFKTDGVYPVERLRLGLPQLNTIAHAEIYSRPNTDTSWRSVVEGTLFRLEGKTTGQRNPTLELPADTDREWRIVVDTSNGGLGSGLPSVAVGWRPATLTFVARGTAPFTLAVGNASLTSNAVSRDDLLIGTTSDVASAHVGQELSAPASEAQSAPTTQGDASRRYVLWGALLLAVGVLGTMAWRLAKGGRERDE